MNNSTTSIAFSIYSNKGIYALFLGSGISKPSGIPTGWDIVIDLIKKLATVTKEEITGSPEKWFESKYGEEPDYSNLLARLVKSSSERMNFLKPYFEPTDEEIEQGLKIPTPAHKAIAQLVKEGYIKVIITTNFDRLLEKALNEIGIEPVVIRHPDDIDGSEPIAHTDFILVKINGDYLDSRFLNTAKELSSYNPKLQDYLQRIVGEFGILSCGWSAKWDTGFVEILRKCQNFRYFSYWTYIGNCEKELKDVAKFRKGETVKIENADIFFTEIVDKIEALRNLNDNHPLTTDIAIARLKKYIVNPESKILLHELVYNIQEDVNEKLRSVIDLSLYPDNQHLMPHLKKIESIIEPVLNIAITGTYWAKSEHYYLFTNLLLRLSEPPPTQQKSTYDVTQRFYYFQSLFLLYSIGITALYSKKYDLLNTCFKLKVDENDSDFSRQFVLIEKVNSYLIDPKYMNSILATGSNQFTPISSYTSKKLWPYFRGIISTEREFNDIFDVFEYLLALNCIIIEYEGIEHSWAPTGQFHWRSRRVAYGRTNPVEDFVNEANRLKNNWEVLKGGMFDGNYDTFVEAKSKLDDFLKNVFFH